MAETLTLKGGAPYNIVKEGGRWYFAPVLFGSEYRNLPKELRLVPEALIPTVVNKGGRTGYLPENTIASHFKSPEFDQAFNRWKTIYQTPTAVAQRELERQQTMQGAKPRTELAVPKSSLDVANTVSSVLNNYNQDQRSTKFNSQKDLVDSKTGETKKTTAATLPKGWFGATGTASTTAYSIAQDKMPNGDYKYQFTNGIVTDPTGKEEYLLIPNSEGKVDVAVKGVYENQLSTLSKADRIAWQKAIGSRTLDGILKPDEVTSILGYARMASFQNLSAMRSGEKNYKPISPLDFAKQWGASSGAGKTTTDTTRTITSFTKEFAYATLSQFYQETVGRAPTDKEVAAFTKSLNANAEKRPDISTVTSTQGTAGTTSTVRKTAGFGGQEATVMAQKQAQQLPGATGFLGATKYMDVIMDMIRNPVG